MAIRDRAVLETLHLLVGAGVIDGEPVALDGASDADRELAVTETIVVGVFLAGVDAVGQRGDDLAEPGVGVLEHGVEDFSDHLAAKFLAERDDAYTADTSGSDHG